MKNFIVLVISVILIFGCNHSKNDTNEIGENQFLEDFDVFQNIFEQANAGLYKYHTKKEVDSIFSLNRERITNKTSYRDFYNIVWTVIDFTGSCHNGLHYPDSLVNVIDQQKIFFPIPLKYLNGKLYSNSNYNEISLGSEILSINNINSEKFIQNTSIYVSTDGHNTTGKYAFLETDWLPFYTYLAYGEQNNFTIEYKKDSIVKQTTLNAVDYATVISNYKDKFTPSYEKESPKYSFLYINNQTGLLNVNTFALGNSESETHKNMQNSSTLFLLI